MHRDTIKKSLSGSKDEDDVPDLDNIDKESSKKKVEVSERQMQMPMMDSEFECTPLTLTTLRCSDKAT